MMWHNCSEEEIISFVRAELDSPSHDENITDKETHLRRRLVNEKQVETIGQSQLTLKPHNSAKDPLKWFGVLVPPSLRTAQKNFKEGVGFKFFKIYLFIFTVFS